MNALDNLTELLEQNTIKAEWYEVRDMLWLAQYLPGLRSPIAEADFLSQDKTATTLTHEPTTENGVGGDAHQDGQMQAKADINRETDSIPVHMAKPEQNASGGRLGSPIRVPYHKALDDELALARALRPLRIRVPDRTRQEIDIATTVKHITQMHLALHPHHPMADLWYPITKPKQERWLDIRVLIDTSPSMMLWEQSVTEFTELLRRHGAFRNVTVWSLDATLDENEAVQFFSGQDIHDRNPRSVGELIDPVGRTLVLLVSDCIAPGWRTGAVAEALEPLELTSMIALFQVLPQRLWHRTGLGIGTSNYFRTIGIGTPNRYLEERYNPYPIDDLDEDSSTHNLKFLNLPVITFDRHSLHRWSLSLAGRENLWIPGISLPNVNLYEQPERDDSDTDSFAMFLSMASPLARKLAVLLAAAPVLNLPLIHTIQKELLRESDMGHLAEVFFGGILFSSTPGAAYLDPNTIYYGFKPEVREKLLALSSSELSLPVMKLVYLGISGYIDRESDQSLDFYAILANPSLLNHVKPMEETSFAEVSALILSRLGWQYRDATNRLQDMARTELVHIWQELQDFRDLLQENRFTEAEEILVQMRGSALSRAEKQRVDMAEGEFTAGLNEARDVVVEVARRYQTESPGDLEGQRKRWQVVTHLKAEYQEAARAISILDSLELLQNAFDELRQIRAQLSEIRKRIDLVENARSQVERMRYDSSLQDADVQSEIQQLYDDLSSIRNEILTASRGGVSSEREQQYDKAIQVYRDAINLGFTQIVNDQTGEFIDPQVRLRETLALRDRDYVARVAAAYGEAEIDLREGAPEAASARLMQAQKILNEAGTETGVWQTRIDQLLEEVQKNARDKERAALLVTESESGIGFQSRSFLIRAREIYPDYPRLAERIHQKERQLVDSVLVGMRADRLRAESHRNGHRYDQARTQAEQMLRRGQEFDFITESEEFLQLRREAEELIRRIDTDKTRWSEFQNQLKGVRTALHKPDKELAQHRLETIDAEYPDHPEVIELQVQITLLSNIEEQWQEAHHLFNQTKNMEQVVTLCDNLLTSHHGDEAEFLQRRARARLWGQQGREQERLALLSEAQASYNRVLDLRGLLPVEDQHLLEEADAEVKSLTQRLEQARRYRQRLDDIVRLRSQELWSEWHARLQVLEADAGDLLLREVTGERAAGIPLWRENALNKAETALIGRESDIWRTAYTLLEPLYKLGAIEDGNPRYRTIAYNYHQYEAELRQESRDPRELEKAVEHLHQLLAVAEPPALEEKKNLQKAIRRRALRLAQYAAADSNLKQAVTELQKQLETYRYELQEDVEVRSHLIYYALRVEDFEIAQSAAQALQFLPGMREQGRAWQLMVRIVEDFAQNSSLTAWEVGVTGLDEVREMAPDNGMLRQSVDEFVTRAVEELRSSLSLAADLSDDKLLHRIRVYVLILHLNPQDYRARVGIIMLADRLNALASEVNNRVRRLLNEENRDILMEMEQLAALDGGMAALFQAFKLMDNQNTEIAQLLSQNMRSTQIRVQQLQEYGKQFAELESLYRKALAEDWETAALDSALQSAVRTARNLGLTRQASEWEARVRLLKDVLEKLRHILDRLEQAWISERYGDVEKECDELESALRRGRATLNQRGLALPAHAIDLYDAHARRNLSALEAVRTAAQEKEQNLILWQHWVQRFEGLQADRVARENATDEHLNSTPPCLTDARKELNSQIDFLQRLVLHLEERNLPPAPLSNEASRFSRQIFEDNLYGQVDEALHKVNDKLTAIDQKLGTLDRPIAQLRGFLGGNVNMQQRANQETFRRQAESIRRVDASHPELLKLIDRFERLARVKY